MSGVIHECPLTEKITQDVMHNLDLNKFEDSVTHC